VAKGTTIEDLALVCDENHRSGDLAGSNRFFNQFRNRRKPFFRELPGRVGRGVRDERFSGDE
jgi:hypothetical protein